MLVGVLPGQDLGQGVGAGDEEQLVVGALGGMQVAQGVDRVGRTTGRSMSTRLTVNRGLLTRSR